MDPTVITFETIPATMDRLTPRQMEIAMHLAQGLSYKQIATLLSIKTITVRKHIYESCRRVGVENKSQLIVAFAKWQVLSELQITVDSL